MKVDEITMKTLEKENNQTALRPVERNYVLLNWLSSSKEAIICLSSNFSVLELNQTAEDIFSKERKEILGKSFLDLCAEVNLKFPFSVGLKGILPNQKITDVETSLLNGDKSIKWTITHTDAENSSSSLFVLIGEDITAFRQKEAALQNLEKYSDGTNNELAEFSHLVTGQDVISKKPLIEYAKNIYKYMDNIIANMPISVYWLNRQGEYLGCSDRFASLFKLQSRDEIIGKTYKDLYDKKSGNFYKAVDAEVMYSGVAKALEEPLYHSDGSESVWLSSKVPLRDTSDQVIGMLGTSVDITERKKVERALKEAKEAAEIANKVKTEFLENIRHDIRTPLSGIVGFSDLLVGEKNTEKIDKYTRGIAKASKELLSFLNEILESINVASGEIPLLKKKFKLRDILDKVISLNKPNAIKKRINLELQFDEAIPAYLIGDPIRIYRVVLELIGNALKFTEQGSVIVMSELVKQEKRDIEIKIIVEDTGPGIPLEKQQELFVRFNRLTASYKGIHKGVGLGLSIVKQFIDELQGEIYILSHPGMTTKFICNIPLKEALLNEALGVEVGCYEPIERANNKQLINEIDEVVY